MLFSMLMFIRKHPIMSLVGLSCPLAYPLAVSAERLLFGGHFVFSEGFFFAVVMFAYMPVMLFTFVIFMCCVERDLGSKWLELGLRYAHEANGDGQDVHAVKAAKYFIKSTLLFDKMAIVNLGLCYAYGFGVEKNPQKAAKCYRVAAEGKEKEDDYKLLSNDRDIAQLALGLCYADGIGVERDKIKAEDLFSKAQPTYVDLQKIWNPKEVVMWFRVAGERGNAFAQDWLGDYYRRDRNDYAEAVKWYRKAAEQGTAYAQTRLGKCYLNGTGVEKDEVEAVKWFRKAVEHGYAEEYILLASCYLSGTGVARDEVEALTWFRRAAKKYGYCADRAKIYLKAVEDDNPEAQCELASDYQYGWHCAKNEAEAIKWYRKAAEQGYADAQVCLGKCYLTGEGVPADEAKAVEWIQKAARQGHEEAKQLLNEISK